MRKDLGHLLAHVRLGGERLESDLRVARQDVGQHRPCVARRPYDARLDHSRAFRRVRCLRRITIHGCSEEYACNAEPGPSLRPAARAPKSCRHTAR